MSARGQDAASKDNETNFVYKSKYCCPVLLTIPGLVVLVGDMGAGKSNIL